MVFVLYDLLLTLIAAVLIPWYLVRRLFGLRSRQGLRQRFGLYSSEVLAPLAGRPVIWVHAVSVGETRAALPLLRELKKEWPDHALLLTNVTETGHEVAQNSGELDLCLFFPLDHSLVIKRVLKQLAPSLIVVIETEIWPNLIRYAALRHIPLALVNGRISDRSYPRYQRCKALLAPLLRQIPLLCMQSEVDRERVISMGASPGSVLATGNLKFDMALHPDLLELGRLRALYRLPDGLPLWICGSTHEGEELMALQAYRTLLDQGLNMALIIAPRHPPRISAVDELLTNQKFLFRRRSQLTKETPLLQRGEVLLVDTLGELLHLYSVSDLVFVGGSLVPVGGHNLLEASLVGRPVIFGPYTHNFREISQLILAVGAGSQLASGDELVRAVESYLSNPDRSRREGDAGRKLIAQHSGATARTVALLRQMVSR